MYEIEHLFDLDVAVKWIKVNSFKCLALEFPVYLVRFSVAITNYLNSKLNASEFYNVILNCCSVDYVSPRHLNGQADAIIRFGKCCLASPPNGIIEYPILFLFENYFLNDQSREFIENYLKDEFKSDEDSLIIVDTNCLKPTLDLVSQLNLNVSIGKFIKFTNKWTFTAELNDYFIDLSEVSCKDVKETNESRIQFYNYLLDKQLSNYKRLYYIGDQIPNSFKILSLLQVIHLNVDNRIANQIQTNKELMKRSSLIEKVKKLNKFGVVFTHSYPNINPFVNSIRKLAKRKKKQINFITLVQTTDEAKLGNFAALESLVLINSCYCSHLINTISLHIPLINFDEFKISCGLKLEYGQVKWNDELNEEDLNEEDLKDEASQQLLLDDRNTALVENYLKEDKWFGLKVNAGQDAISDLKRGLKGIAMGYGENEFKK